MLLCSRDPGYIRDDLTISTKPDHCILVVRLTSRLINCTSQSRTRKLSESSLSSFTCSLSGALLEFLPPSLYSVQQKCLKYFASKQLWNHDIWPVFAQSSLGAILLSLYYVFLWKNPHTQAALQKAKVITMLIQHCWMLRLNPKSCWQFCWALFKPLTDGDAYLMQKQSRV